MSDIFSLVGKNDGRLKGWTKGPKRGFASQQLNQLLCQFLPSNSGEKNLNYVDVLSLGLLLCSGTIFEKAKVFHSLIIVNEDKAGVVQ